MISFGDYGIILPNILGIINGMRDFEHCSFVDISRYLTISIAMHIQNPLPKAGNEPCHFGHLELIMEHIDYTLWHLGVFFPN